uniref:Uncharacterized protein LOC114334479 n=1 Tax=Diabrotica virgifera virgifera TaxID=50390 RepID=A0A6P7FZV3_DIAVI
MESTFKPPESLILDGNISENWRKFSQKFDLFMIATDLTSKPESKKLAVLLSLVGDEALELYNTFTFAEDEDRTVTCVKKKFEEYCSPKKNVIFERFKFNSISQQKGTTNLLSRKRRSLVINRFSFILAKCLTFSGILYFCSGQPLMIKSKTTCSWGSAIVSCRN